MADIPSTSDVTWCHENNHVIPSAVKADLKKTTTRVHEIDDNKTNIWSSLYQVNNVAIGKHTKKG